MLRDHCSLYNGALQERRDAYRHPSKTTVRYGDQSAQLKEIRAHDPERQGRWSFSSQQTTLRRPDKAMQAFFHRVKAGERPGYPRFKGIGHFDTVVFPKDGDGCRWDSSPHDTATRVRFQGVGHIRVHQYRPVPGRIKTISHEKLNIAGMTRIPKAKPDPDNDGRFLSNGAAAKAGLNHSILDAGWGQFLTILANKAESAGRRVVAVDARNTSRTCPTSSGGCGHVAKENRISQAAFECAACGYATNADQVDALNILRRAGLVRCAVA
jgi:transposase